MHPVETALVAWTLARCGAERVEIEVLGLDHARIPAGEARWEGDPCRRRPSLRLTIVEQGTIRFASSVSPVMAVWRTAPVATATAAPGQIVSVGSAVVRLDQLYGDPVEAGTWEAITAIPTGAPVTKNLVRKPYDAHEGDAVSIVIRRGALVLRADGTLSEDAHVGDRVDVVNRFTHTRNAGVLTSPSVVDISPEIP